MLGVHVAKESLVLDVKKSAAEMADAIDRDVEKLGINAVQIFTYGPRFITKNKMDYNLVKRVCADLELSVHSAYPTTKIWSIKSNSEPIIDRLIDQIESCKAIGANSLVIHITKIHYETAADVMAILEPIIKPTGIKFVVEMVASKADDDLTYETPEKINRLTEMVGPAKWWGWCVDTAHLWGAGVDIKKYVSMKRWLAKLKYPICMFHLNGSSAALGSGKDKHEIAGGPDDKIWGSLKVKTRTGGDVASSSEGPNASGGSGINNFDYENSGVRAVVEYAKKRKIPMICEIKRGAESDTAKLLDLIKDKL